MTKKWWKYSILTILIGGILYACLDEDVDIREEAFSSMFELSGRESPEVLRAKAWYEAHEEQVYLSRSGEVRENPLFAEVNPVWREAYVVRDTVDPLITVEVPIASLSNKTFAFPENARAYESTEDLRYIQSLTYLIICTDLRNSRTVGFFMTQIPSKMYMAIKDFRAYTLTYLTRAEDYDGTVLFHSLNGEFLNGWIYEEGQLTKKLKGRSCDCESRSYEYEIFCAPVYEEIWVNYYYGSEQGGNYEYNGSKLLGTNYIGDDCFIVEYWIDDGVGGGGGGGLTPGGGGGGAVENPEQPQETQEDRKSVEEEDCFDIVYHASMKADSIWSFMEEEGFYQDTFASVYSKDTIEHGFYLKIDEQGFLSHTDVSHGKENGVVIGYTSEDGGALLAMVHNHPKNNAPSMLDMYTLTKLYLKYGGKIKHSFIVGKSGRIIDMQVVDSSKVRAFYDKYTIVDDNGVEKRNDVALNDLLKKMGEYANQVSLGAKWGDSGIPLEQEIKECTHFAFAYLLEVFDIGIVLLQQEEGGFKLLKGDKQKNLTGEDVIYRKRCK